MRKAVTIKFPNSTALRERKKSSLIKEIKKKRREEKNEDRNSPG